jgi:small subunit ribosomal protein S2
LRCIQVIAGVLGRAGEEGQRKRLEAAKTGEVTWLPPPGLGRPETEEERAKSANRGKRVMKMKEEEDEKVLETIKKRAKFQSSADEDL